MNLEELKATIKTKSFNLKEGDFTYKFIPENTIQVNGSLANSIHYSIEEEGDDFILNHGNSWSTEPLVMKFKSFKTPMELDLIEKFSGKHFATWIEEHTLL